MHKIVAFVDIPDDIEFRVVGKWSERKDDNGALVWPDRNVPDSSSDDTD